MGDWHKLYLDKLEKLFLERSDLREKYEIENSNRRRLYLPRWKGIKRKEILSNPDMLLINKDCTLEYVLELEYNINYKKLVGIALLTDMAVGKMQMGRKKPKLILITRKRFPNLEFIEKEIKTYLRNIEFQLFTTDTFNLNVLV